MAEPLTLCHCEFEGGDADERYWENHRDLAAVEHVFPDHTCHQLLVE